MLYYCKRTQFHKMCVVSISWEVNYPKKYSGRRLTYVWRSRGRRVQCNIEEVKVFESLWELRVDPDLDAPAPPPPPSRRSNPSDVVLRAVRSLHIFLYFASLTGTSVLTTALFVQDLLLYLCRHYSDCLFTFVRVCAWLVRVDNFLWYVNKTWK